MNSTQYNMKSSQIAKNRLINMQSNDKAVALSENNSTQSKSTDYIQNDIHIDNNLLWKNNHNALSSKGD